MTMKANTSSDLGPEGEGGGYGARFVEVSVHELELRDAAVSDGLEPRVTLQTQVNVTL